MPTLADVEATRRRLTARQAEVVANLVQAAEVETEEAADLDGPKMLGFEQALMRLSSAVSDRYFLQGANAVPTVKLVGLA